MDGSDLDLEEKCYIQELSDDVIRRVFRLIPSRDVMNAAEVCRRWRKLAKDPSLWLYPSANFFCLETPENSPRTQGELVRFLRHAPYDCLNTLEVMLTSSDSNSLRDVVFSDSRPVRSLLIVFDAPLIENVTEYVMKQRDHLEQLKLIADTPLQYPRWDSLSWYQEHMSSYLWPNLIDLPRLFKLSLNCTAPIYLAPRLEELELSTWTPVAELLVLQNSATLRTLTIWGSHTDSAIDLTVIGKCKNLVSVNVPATHDISALENCTKLVHLGICRGPVADASIGRWLRSSRLSRRLTSLGLKEIEGSIFQAVSGKFMPNLRRLSLDKCLPEMEARTFCSLNPMLQELSITFNVLLSREYFFVNALAWGAALPSLRTLNLSGMCQQQQYRGFSHCVAKLCERVSTKRPTLRIFLSGLCVCELRTKTDDSLAAIRNLMQTSPQSKQCDSPRRTTRLRPERTLLSRNLTDCELKVKEFEDMCSQDNELRDAYVQCFNDAFLRGNINLTQAISEFSFLSEP